MQHWLVKQEPEEYSWEQLVADGVTDWTGVRNHQASAYLREMKPGDAVLVYHSCGPKCVVGVARVRSGAKPDPSPDGEGWVCVELEPKETLARPVTLAQIKADPALEGIALVRQSRLSVMPLTAAFFRRILELAGRPGAIAVETPARLKKRAVKAKLRG